MGLVMAEQPVGRMRYTDAEINQIGRLRERCYSWKQIRAAIGRPSDTTSIAQAYKRHISFIHRSCQAGALVCVARPNDGSPM